MPETIDIILRTAAVTGLLLPAAVMAASGLQRRATVLVTMGEYDWFENRAGHETVARIVNRRGPGLARLQVIPAMDHHFTLFDSAEAAFAGEGGRPDADPFLRLALPWLAAR